MKAAQTVGHADQSPFQSNFSLPSQTKPPEPDGLFDDSKYRLDGLLSVLVFSTTFFGRHAMGHFLAEVGFLSRCGRVVFFLQIGHTAMMGLAILATGFGVAAPYLTIQAMKQQEKVVILDPGGTLIYAPLLGFEDAGNLHAYHVRLACLALLQRNPIGPDLPDLMKRLYLEEPARKKAAALYKTQNPEFKEKQIHQKAEVTKIDILDTREISDGSGKSYEAVSVRAEGNLVRTGTVNNLEFREPVKFQTEFLFIRNPDLLGNGRLPLVVQDFKYSEKPL